MSGCLDVSTLSSNRPGGDSALVKKLGRLVLLSGEEIAFLESIQNNTVKIDKGAEFIKDGEAMQVTYIIQSGWAIRYSLLSSGSRQILGFVLPGDILGLHANFYRTASYNASALTPVQAAVVDPRRVMEIHQKYPILASGLSWCTAREFAILGDHAVRLGRQSAMHRLAHLFLELWYRAELIGETSGEWLDLPMTQTDMADALGLSLVHLNRTLHKLQGMDLISIRKKQIRLNNFEKLMKMSDFNPAHLECFRA